MSNDAIFITMIRAGRVTFFIDIKTATNGAKYLSISESRVDADSKKSRSTIRVFGETIEQFRQAVSEAATAAQQ